MIGLTDIDDRSFTRVEWMIVMLALTTVPIGFLAWCVWSIWRAPMLGEVLVDEGWELLATSSPLEIAELCVETAGMPPYLRGSYFISGPALFEIGKYSFNALFDGFGKINRFNFGGGRICYTSSFLNTSYRMDNQKLAAEGQRPRGVLFDDTTPPRGLCPIFNPMCDMMATNDNNWVSAIPFQDHAFLMSDTPYMLVLNTTSTQVAGRAAWADDSKHTFISFMTQPEWIDGLHIPSVSSAHPLRRPGTSEYVEFVVEVPFLVPAVEHHYLTFYTFDAQQKSKTRKLFARIEVDKHYYMHSFGVTENYIVCPFNMVMNLPMPPKHALLTGSFQDSWKGVHVIDREGKVQVFETDPFFHTHIINSFENSTGIVMDLGTYVGNPFAKSPQMHIKSFKDKRLRDSIFRDFGKMEIARLHFHTSGPLKGTATREVLISNGRAIDFFHINPAHEGREYCVFYAVEWFHDDASYADMAVLRHDICKGTTKYWSRTNTYLSEPFFVAGGSPLADLAEGKGVVLAVALDGARGASYMLVLDAETLEEVGRMSLPVHIPFTGHGLFISDAQEKMKSNLDLLFA